MVCGWGYKIRSKWRPISKIVIKIIFWLQKTKSLIERLMFVNFVKKKLFGKATDNCHLTNKNRGPAHNKCNINVIQKRSNFVPFVFHNFSVSDCHPFFKKLDDKKNDKVHFDILPKTNEEYICYLWTFKTYW